MSTQSPPNTLSPRLSSVSAAASAEYTKPHWSDHTWNTATLCGILTWSKIHNYWKRYNTEQQEWFRSYSNRATKTDWKNFDLPSLSYRRLRGDAIETFKYLRNIYPVDSSTLIALSQPTGGVVTVWKFIKESARYRREQIMFLVFVPLISGMIYQSMW